MSARYEADESEMAPVRHSRVIGRAVQTLACDCPPTEDDFVETYGSRGSRQFWEDYLFGVVSISGLVHTLSILGATAFNNIDVRAMALRTAFLEAHQADVPWFRGQHQLLADVDYLRKVENPELIKVITKQAVEWLARNPRRRHLVPGTLAEFLRSNSAPQAENEPTPTVAGNETRHALEPIPKARGPKPAKRASIVAKMLRELASKELLPDELYHMKEEVLASRYDAARDTCRKARNEALSEFRRAETPTNSDHRQIATKKDRA